MRSGRRIVIDPGTGRLVEGDIGTQTAQVFRNLEAVLRAAGLSLDDVVKVNGWPTTIDDFAAMNGVYRAVVFNAPCPARTTVAVHELPLGARAGIELVASARSAS